ncbi:MAG: hypothetical protein ACYDCW_15500 [Acidithiobacillus ferrivorans]
MPCFDAHQLAYGVRNGNMVTIMVGDLLVGFGQTSSASSDRGQIQQLPSDPTISIDSFELTENGLESLGYPLSMLEVLSNNSFDFHLTDENGLPILTYVGAVAVAQNLKLNIQANQAVTQNVVFKALDILDTKGDSILN